MDDVERRVQGEIDRLSGPEFSRRRDARQMRNATIRALAEATLARKPWTGPNGVLGPKRPAVIVSESNFYGKGHWWAHPLVREVIQAVTDIYGERDAGERETARLEKRAWLENKELEAAETQFAKAADLLSLPHIAKKTKQGEGATGTTIILDPANAAVFNAAVNLNMKASDLARRSLGLPTDVKRSELTGAEGGSISVQGGLNEEEVDAVIRNLKAALGADAD